MEKGILEGKSESIDTTHIKANTIKKTLERLMKHLARKIIHTYEVEVGQTLGDLPTEPEYKNIDDHEEAKAVMKSYYRSLLY